MSNPTVLDITNSSFISGYQNQINSGGSRSINRETYQYAYQTVRSNTNMQGIDVSRLAGVATTTLGSITGIPQVAPLLQSSLLAGDSYDPGRMYTSVPFYNLNKTPGVAYQDFRNRKGTGPETTLSKRYDGLAATGRGNLKSAIYLAAATSVGAYSVYNRDANNFFGAGWGDHGNIYALRNDFTVQSHVATKWDISKGGWVQTKNIQSIGTPFRGDRIQVIDYRRNVDLKRIYSWKPNILGADVFDSLGITQDFIKFFFTGPNLSPGLKGKSGEGSSKGAGIPVTDDAVVFRAAITSVSDTFQPNWTPVQMIGRADSNHHYTGYARDLSISFTVYATDRDEVKPIWRKLNALAGMTAPIYNENSISLEGPWIRFTLGDLYYQQPAIITSLIYTLHDGDTTWEINIEQDKEMMQVPKKITVDMGLTLITNELPQRDGRFYTLANQFDRQTDKAIPGDDNWLSDFKGNFSYTDILTPEQISKLIQLGTLL